MNTLKSGASGDRTPANSAVSNDSDNNPTVGLRVKLDSLLATKDCWEAACSLLAQACRKATGIPLNGLPDMPEIDELRHTLYDKLQSYAGRPSDRQAESVLSAYTNVREAFATRLEELIY